MKGPTAHGPSPSGGSTTLIKAVEVVEGGVVVEVAGRTTMDTTLISSLWCLVPLLLLS
jgi:hypothetical protein